MEDKERLENLEALLSDYDTLIKGYEEDVAYLDFESVFEQYVTNDKGKFFKYLDGMTTQKNSKAPKIKKYLTEEAQKISSGFNKLQIFDFEEFDTVQKNIAIDYLMDIYKKDGVLKNYYDIHKSFFVYFSRFLIDFIKDASSADLLDDEIAHAFFELGSYSAKIDLCTSITNLDILKDLHSLLASSYRKSGHKMKDLRYKQAVKDAISEWEHGSKKHPEQMAKDLCDRFNNHLIKETSKTIKDWEDRRIDDEEKNKAITDFNRKRINPKKLAKMLIEFESTFRQNK